MSQPWRTHPRLQSAFHPDHPDDLRIVIHQGGPRITNRRPEVVWTTVTSCEGNLCRGRLLNQPTQLDSFKLGTEVTFLIPDSKSTPLFVTDKYLRERPNWTIHACNKCGLSELFDAPSDLIRVIFPNIPPGTVVETFTTFCPVCGGVQTVEQNMKSAVAPSTQPPEAYQTRSSGKSWWKFWK